MSELPRAPIRRLMESVGAERIGKAAVIALRELVEEHTKKVSGEAVSIAEDDGRKTVREEDVRTAANLFERGGKAVRVGNDTFYVLFLGEEQRIYGSKKNAMDTLRKEAVERKDVRPEKAGVVEVTIGAEGRGWEIKGIPISQVLAVHSQVKVKGSKNVEVLEGLVDTGATMTIIDEKLAESIGVRYTGKTYTVRSASGHKLEGELAKVRALTIQGEELTNESVLVVEFKGDLKRSLRESGLSDSIILGMTTIKAAGFMADTTTGKLRKR